MLAPHQSSYSFIPITFVGHYLSTCCGLLRATNLFISMEPTLNTCEAAADGTAPFHLRSVRVFLMDAEDWRSPWE